MLIRKDFLMKTPFFSLPRHLLLHTLSTLCIGFGCAYPLALAMHLFTPAPLCFLCCCGIALLFALLDCMPRLRALAYPLILAAIIYTAIQSRDQLSSIGAAITLFMNGQPLALSVYSRPVIILISLLMTSIGSSLARSDSAFFPLALLTIAELIILSFLGIDVHALSLFPLVLALLIAARVPGADTVRVIPCAALVLLLSALFLPLAGHTLPELSRYAEKTRQKIDDYLFFTDPRTAFSLSSTGWQPYGAERLGGPVNPTNDPVMQVKTPQRALLRGTIKNEYTGLSWADTTSGRRYLYVSPRFMQLRRNLFDSARPERSLRGSLPDSEPIRVTMAADSASTLYLTQRFSSPKGGDIVPYFSPASEVFATRSLSPGDSYTFTGRLMTASSEGIRDAVVKSHDESDPYYPIVCQTYLQLPSSVDPRVYALAQQLTEHESDSFDKAAALCEYLQTSFPYTMNQSIPPLTQDFVSWFLFEEQQGYCTSFASSMCVLARAAGLPARYVEGYAAIPDSDGIARVTQQYAHAWSEVYFPGFGWLTFDPTPGSGGDADGTGDGLPDRSNRRPDNDSESPDQTGNPDMPDDSSTENAATPSPIPTETPTPIPTPSPSPTPQHNDPAVTPTPEITPAPSPVKTPTPRPSTPPRQDSEKNGPSPWLIALLLLLLSVVLLTLRFVFTSPFRLADQCRNPSDAVLVWYGAICDVLLCMDVTQKENEAPATFLTRAQETIGKSVNLAYLMRAVCIARYSSHKLKRTQVDKARVAYESLLSLLTPAQRIRLYARRLFFGVRIH